MKRNRLKYKMLHKLVFAHTIWSWKRGMDSGKVEIKEIEVSFDPINIDYIFRDDPRS